MKKPTMNVSGPLATAFLRGFYGAALGFAGTFLTIYATTNQLKASLIGAGTAACIALGWRGGAEGGWDQKRNNEGNVKPSDVSS